MSATGIVTQRIGEYQYRVASEVGIDVEFTGHSISKESLTIGERVRIIEVYSGIDDMPRYGFARENSGLRGVIAIPYGQGAGFAEQSPANFAAAYIAYYAGKVQRLYDIGRVMEVMDSSNLRVIMLTGDFPYAERVIPCSGVFSGSFVRDDIALIRRGADRDYVVGWWAPVAGFVTIDLTMLDTDGNILTYDLMNLFGGVRTDAGLYYWNDDGDLGYYDPDFPPELPRGVKGYVYAIDGYTYKFVEWTEINIAIDDKTAYQQDWPAVKDLTTTLTFERLPTEYKIATWVFDEQHRYEIVVQPTIYQAMPGDTISLNAPKIAHEWTRYDAEGDVTSKNWYEFINWTVHRGYVSVVLPDSAGQNNFDYIMPPELDNENPPTRTYFQPNYVRRIEVT